MMLSVERCRELACFGAVGIGATAVHYGVALGTTKTLGANVYIANLAGYLCAVMVSFFGHGHLTFRTRVNARIFQRFIVVSIGAFSASEALLVFLETALRLDHAVALAFTVMVVPAVSYLLNKCWVYTHQ